MIIATAATKLPTSGNKIKPLPERVYNHDDAYHDNDYYEGSLSVFPPSS